MDKGAQEMKCKKCQWDYIGNFSIGYEEIIMYRPRFACWLCPYCGKEKLIEIRKWQKHVKIAGMKENGWTILGYGFI